MKKTYLIIVFLGISELILAQPSNGKLNSLLAAENYFSALVKSKGLKKAFLQVSDEQTLVFRPEPVKAKAYFEKQEETTNHVLSWQPAMARIAKSGDWGFSAGPFRMTANEAGISDSFGHYLSVWRTNEKGIWKLALDLGVNYPEPKTELALDYKEPKNAVYFHQPSVKRLDQRADVVLINDRLFSTTLSGKGLFAYREFLSEKAQLLFPGNEPIVGKEQILEFWNKHPFQIKSEPLRADRSKSGEWAYTQGNAILTLNNNVQSYYYVRIWELQQGFNWNLVLEIFTPAAQ